MPVVLKTDGGGSGDLYKETDTVKITNKQKNNMNCGPGSCHHSKKVMWGISVMEKHWSQTSVGSQEIVLWSGEVVTPEGHIWRKKRRHVLQFPEGREKRGTESAILPEKDPDRQQSQQVKPDKMYVCVCMRVCVCIYPQILLNAHSQPYMTFSKHSTPVLAVVDWYKCVLQHITLVPIYSTRVLDN